MGKGKPRWKAASKAARTDDGSDSEDSVEVGDIEALARGSLRSGETILGAGQSVEQVESRGICQKPLLLAKMEEIEYTAPKDAKRVPWVDTLCIDGWKEVPKDVKAKDGVKLEGAFVELAMEAVKESYRRFNVMKVPCSRPTDFYAEMFRTDAQMFRVRARASEEQRRIKIVESRKSSQAAKKFAKSVRVKRLEDRAGEKRKTLEDIEEWRTKNKEDKKNVDERDLDDILDGQKKFKKKGQDSVSKKQQFNDKKWGHGGKKKRSKQNDKESTNDMGKSPWAKKGQGKGAGKDGKGKGGGGKGKGGSKGVGKFSGGKDQGRNKRKKGGFGN